MVRKSVKTGRSSNERDKKGHELSSLFEVAKSFLEIKDLDSLKQQIVISSLGIVGANGGTLLEFDSVRNNLALSVCLGPNATSAPKTRLPLRKRWQDFLVRENHGMSVDISNASRNSTLKSFARSNPRLISAVQPKLLVPICEEEKLWGILCLQEKILGKRYSIDDFNLLTSLASLAAKTWRNLASSKPREKKKPVPGTDASLWRLPPLKVRKELSILRKQYPLLREIVGESRAILSVFRSIVQVAKTKCPVLILGQTGTGKELVAQAIHGLSTRQAAPFVELNCASVPSELIESELFGYVRGAFTGATGERKGIFEQANNGTLFLDEIGDMSLNLQTKLLRVIQEGRFRRLGAEKNIEVDVRIITASNKDLVREARRGNFREDLLYRINVYPVYLPQLGERDQDVALLADYFLKETVSEFGLQRKDFSSDALDLLQTHTYPGNIRELKNLVERVAIRSGDETVIDSFWLEQEMSGRTSKQFYLSEETFADGSHESSVPAGQEGKPELIFKAELVPEGTDPDESRTGLTLKEIERAHIERVLEKTNQNKTKAAKILGIPRSTLIGKMKKLKMV